MKSSKGFSLIELLVVITIIGLISAIAVPAYLRYSYKSKVAATLVEGTSLTNALKQYFDQNGSYPGSILIAGNSVSSGGCTTPTNMGNITYACYTNNTSNYVLTLCVSGLSGITNGSTSYSTPGGGNTYGGAACYQIQGAYNNGVDSLTCGTVSSLAAGLSLPSGLVPSSNCS
jgi:prepilin-type N-terminal cleavage/methylation domain-containing protein